MEQQKDAAGVIVLRPDESTIAGVNFQRYEYGRDRGHKDYVIAARRCERFYFGCGGQWREKDRKYLEDNGRPVIELNTIFPAINTALGEQLQTRVDIAYRPRSSAATQETADTLCKLAMHIKDDNDYPSVESQVYGDGIIQRRGYFDVRMEFDENLSGSIRITSLDPLDVIPDPDAQSYDPKDWKDVTVTRWLSLDEIEMHYGPEARVAVQSSTWVDEGWGREDTNEDDQSGRNSFGDRYTGRQLWDAFYEENGVKRYRVLDRQHRIWSLQLHFVDPVTKDISPVPDSMKPDEARVYALQNQLALTKISRMRIRWTVTTRFNVLHDDWSPYSDFTVVGYFPYFRRGKTVGLVDNAISPQELTNKSLSSELHVVNSTANSGWIVEEGSLSNMTPQQLEEKGSETGLVVVHKQGTKAPQKIMPTPIPPTFGRMSQMGTAYVNTITGMSQQEQGNTTGDISGVAVQSLQMQAKIQLGPAIDNLARTRRYVARIILKLIQQFYTVPRIIKIEGKDRFGQTKHEDLPINQADPAGRIINDLTLGEYGVVITATPISPTFEQTQFTQAKELRGLGVPIPDAEMVMYSNLEDKTELAKKMSAPVDPTVEAAKKAALMKMEAEIKKLEAQARDADADATLKKLQTIYAAMEAGTLAVNLPGTASVADTMLASSGFVDEDNPPVIPEGGPAATGSFLPQNPQAIAGPGAMARPVGPENSHPVFPPKPGNATAGIGATPGTGMM